MFYKRVIILCKYKVCYGIITGFDCCNLIFINLDSMLENNHIKWVLVLENNVFTIYYTIALCIVLVMYINVYRFTKNSR